MTSAGQIAPLYTPTTRPRNGKGSRWLPVPIETRLWHRISCGDPDECWEWLGPRDPKGYGIKVQFNGRRMRPHRIVWVLTHGEITPQECVCHRCDNPACCNPAHLFLGSYADNNHDRDRKGRHTPLQGSRHGNSKLSESDVLEMRRLHAGGEESDTLAERFGVDRSNVWLIVTRRAWKHVP